MRRRDFCGALLAIPAAAQQYAARTRGLAAITIRGARVITTSPEGRYQWAFLKLETSEPGLYGIGSASNLFHCAAIATAIEKTYAPFWIGKNPDRVEDLWQSTNVRSYWRNSTIQNNILGALDMALWDIKGKRAGMPVYDLLGGESAGRRADLRACRWPRHAAGGRQRPQIHAGGLPARARTARRLRRWRLCRAW